MPKTPPKADYLLALIDQQATAPEAAQRRAESLWKEHPDDINLFRFLYGAYNMAATGSRSQAAPALNRQATLCEEALRTIPQEYRPIVYDSQGINANKRGLGDEAALECFEKGIATAGEEPRPFLYSSALASLKRLNREEDYFHALRKAAQLFPQNPDFASGLQRFLAAHAQAEVTPETLGGQKAQWVEYADTAMAVNLPDSAYAIYHAVQGASPEPDPAVDEKVLSSREATRRYPSFLRIRNWVEEGLKGIRQGDTQLIESSFHHIQNEVLGDEHRALNSTALSILRDYAQMGVCAPEYEAILRKQVEWHIIDPEDRAKFWSVGQSPLDASREMHIRTAAAQKFTGHYNSLISPIYRQISPELRGTDETSRRVGSKMRSGDDGGSRLM